MKKNETKISHRIFASLLSALIMFSSIPFSATVYAETDGIEGVTITVVDESGTPIEGASVKYSIADSALANIVSETTSFADGNGELQLMTVAKYESETNALYLTAEISATGYKTKNISDQELTSSDENVNVTLTSTTITSVTVTATDVGYTGESFDAAKVEGLETDDTVTYQLDSELETGTMPTISEVGNYTLIVKVERDGYDDYTETVYPEITAATIDISIQANEALSYNGEEQELVTLTNSFESDDEVTWKVNGVDTESKDIPAAGAVGKYTVELIVDRGSNYELLELSVDVSIGLGQIDLGVLSVEANTLTYNNTEQKLIKVENQGVDYTLQYQLSTDAGTWEDDIPTATDAGSYTVYVKAVKDSYEDAEYETYPISVTIATADQSISFNEYAFGESADVTLSTSPTKYDFSATIDETYLSENVITYSIKTWDAEDNEVVDDSIATISDSGELKVNDAGTIIITASLEGDDNNNSCKITYTLNVYVEAAVDNKLIEFSELRENEDVDYTFGTNAGIISEQQATTTYENDNREITYKIDNEKLGIEIDATTGKVSVSDYEILAEALDNEETLSITVTAEIGEYKNNNVGYSSDSTSYTINISFAGTPDDAYTLIENENNGEYNVFGTIGEGENEVKTAWYVTDIKVTPADGYNIGTGVSSFADNVVISDEGDDSYSYYVYLQDQETGGITEPIKLDGVMIDTSVPDANNMRIEYSTFVLDTLIETITFGFYNPSATITFKIYDETDEYESGINHIDWTYTKDSTATSSIAETFTEELKVTLVEDENGNYYMAAVELTADEANQYRGNISFTVTDNAGNVSAVKTDDENIIVVDTISPTMQAEHMLVDSSEVVNLVGEQYYYSSDVEFTFTVKEANFFSEDVVVTVSKDGGTAYVVSPTWADDESDDETHIATFTLTEDGDYVVSMVYTDKSKNEMTSYESAVITIDKTTPVLGFDFDLDSQSTTFTVTEHNFRESDIIVTGTVLDVNGNAQKLTADDITNILQNGTWTQSEDTYTFVIDNDYVDGIYNLEINYIDISGNEAIEIDAEEFIVDHSSPTGVSIEYSTSIIDTILSVVTLGFYNPDVTVAFTAYDDFSGVDYFTWDYTKEDDASSINRDTDTATSIIDAVQDTEDLSKYTATVILPNTDESELRGYFSVIATDVYGNASDKTTDSGNIIIVDTIAPTMTVEYNEADRYVDDIAYYNNDVEVTFEVNEANFFSEDVVVTVSKDGGKAYAVSPSWTDVNVDEHIGTITLTGDGDYVVYVEYTDRSNNIMASYQSDIKTIDTILPVINVEYLNTDIINTLEDSDGNTREYYAQTQTAVITITEHNFNADEVEFTIIAKDVTGTQLDANTLNSKSSWTVDSTGDVYTITITYPGDANYTFDVEYTDIATNEAEDYSEDYFTVDTTSPVNLSVSYSTSVLDTILESVTVGFYNATMTVTITATDYTTAINSFVYSYLNASGVSSVNAELVEQIIEAANITYSNNGATATATFTVPKNTLTSDNQFNGTVEFTAIDRADNFTELTETKRVVVDNISPTATVTYSEAINIENDISYYDGNIDSTIVIAEANFYSSDVEVMVTKDGETYPVTVSWSDDNTDTHTGTYTLTEDGDYFVTINYADKSSNQMSTYTSTQLTIDTAIENPTITINGDDANGKAYKGDVVLEVNFEDINYDSYELTLTRTSYGSKDVDVTTLFIGEEMSINDFGGTGEFDTFESLIENDGIYTLTVTMLDKSGHTSETVTIFTVNRFGSVYEYSDYLVDLISNGGAYVQEVTDDLIITEYNADRLVEDSLVITITCDGKPIDDVIYDCSTVINEQVQVGDSGWFQYEYTISKENFTADGIYKISISSKDDTGNTPENTNYEGMDISFYVDSTAPEITSITGLEENIVNAQEVIVNYTVFDAIGLKSISVYVNGDLYETVLNEFEDLNNYSGSFTIDESSSAQTIQLIIEDLAGNVTDTENENYVSAFAFSSTVTVSTNAIVRWYANTPLFWGSIIGVIGVASGTTFVLKKKRKKVNN